MKKLIALSIIASQVAACGTHTTYRLRSGYEIEGKPVGRTDDRLTIRTNGGTASVDVCRIAEVSHPGKGMAITGTALLGAGAVIGGASLYGWSQFNDRDTNNVEEGSVGDMAVGLLVLSGLIYSTAMVVTGGALAGGGYTNWNESEERSGPLPAPRCADAEDEGYKPYLPPPPTRETGPERRPGVTRLPPRNPAGAD